MKIWNGLHKINEEVAGRISDDGEIQVLACYREVQEYLPQEYMTIEITQCLVDLSLPEDVFTESASTFTESSEGLIDWFVGRPPLTFYGQSHADHPIASCSELDPVSYSPQSLDQLPSYDFPTFQNSEHTQNQWINIAHITGL